ncbi:hypothetical protein HQ524_01840 [Candidatus Uhrbacteria bacterium]|nr:hypothetical protein [Candidatus Uhrbacteria bacterium]
MTNRINQSITLIIAAFAMVGLFAFGATAQAASVGDDVKCAGQQAVYHLAEDGTRYAYPNERAWKSWHDGFDHVKVISCSDLQDVKFGGLVPYQAGVRLLKIPSVPKVYAVSTDGVLRPIKSEEQAKELYGEDWAKMVDDISEAFFPRYSIKEELADKELPEGMILSGNDGSILRVNTRGKAVKIDEVLDTTKREFYSKHAIKAEHIEQELGLIVDEIRDLESQLEEKLAILRALKTIHLEDDEIIGDVKEFAEVEDFAPVDEKKDEPDMASDETVEDHDNQDGGTGLKSDPDLMVTNVFVDHNGILTAVISNEGYGDVPTENFSIYFWFDGQLARTYSVSTLADKSFILGQHHALIQTGAWDKSAKAGVCVDVNEQVHESVEQNNCWNGYLEAADPEIIDAIDDEHKLDEDMDGIADGEVKEEDTHTDETADDGTNGEDTHPDDTASDGTTDVKDDVPSDDILDENRKDDAVDDTTPDGTTDRLDGSTDGTTPDGTTDRLDGSTDGTATDGTTDAHDDAGSQKTPDGTSDDSPKDTSGTTQDAVSETDLYIHYVGKEWADVSLNSESFGPVKLLMEAIGGDVTVEYQEIYLGGSFAATPPGSSLYIIVEDVTTGKKDQYGTGVGVASNKGTFSFSTPFIVEEGHEVYVTMFIEMKALAAGDSLQPFYITSSLVAYDKSGSPLGTSHILPQGEVATGSFVIFK